MSPQRIRNGNTNAHAIVIISAQIAYGFTLVINIPDPNATLTITHVIRKALICLCRRPPVYGTLFRMFLSIVSQTL